MRVWTVFRIVLILALAVGVASAHHPFSQTYDAAKFGALSGKVAKVQWTNPHVVFALDVASADGKTERWVIEGLPPNTLLRQGWKKDTLREGISISISGWHARNDALKIFHGLEVTFEDGSKRIFGNSPEGADRWQGPAWIPTISE